MNHISPRRLYQLSQFEPSEVAVQATEHEKQHLRDCDECQRIIAVFAREFDSQRPPHDHASEA